MGTFYGDAMDVVVWMDATKPSSFSIILFYPNFTFFLTYNNVKEWSPFFSYLPSI